LITNTKYLLPCKTLGGGRVAYERSGISLPRKDSS
jgi:hypothetical protein